MEEKTTLIKKQQSHNTRSKSCVNTRIKVLLFVFLHCIAAVISSPASTQYVYDNINRHDISYLNSTVSTNKSLDYANNHSKNCRDGVENNDIQAKTSMWLWYAKLIDDAIVLPFILFVAPVTDKIGRKPILMWNLTVMTLSYAVKTVVIYFELPLNFFLLGVGISGLSGGSYAFYASNVAILADLTSTGNDRTMIMATYDAIIGIGAFMSYVGSGYLIQLKGFAYPFAASTVLYILLTLFVLAVLDESYDTLQTRSPVQVTKIPIMFLSIYSKKNMKCRKGYILIYLLIFILALIPNSANLTLYTLGPPFCWTAEHIGWYDAINSLIKNVVGTLVLKVIYICFTKVSDNIIVIVGLFSTTCSLILYGVASEDITIYEGTNILLLQNNY